VEGGCNAVKCGDDAVSVSKSGTDHPPGAGPLRWARPRRRPDNTYRSHFHSNAATLSVFTDNPQLPTVLIVAAENPREKMEETREEAEIYENGVEQWP
jgi:hypothetical protein